MHEPTAGRATLAVLGAGPKGLAIAAKRAALARSGGEVPDLVLVNREGVAANWSGAAGYTDGRQRLSTAPEKDVGFPYAHTWGAASERVSQEVGRWSWQSYRQIRRRVLTVHLVSASAIYAGQVGRRVQPHRQSAIW